MSEFPVSSSGTFSLAAQWRVWLWMLSGLVRHVLRREEAGARGALRQAEFIEAFVLTALAAVIPQIEAQAARSDISRIEAERYQDYLPPIAVILFAMLRLVRQIVQRLRFATGARALHSIAAAQGASLRASIYRIEAIESG